MSKEVVGEQDFFLSLELRSRETEVFSLLSIKLLFESGSVENLESTPSGDSNLLPTGVCRPQLNEYIKHSTFLRVEDLSCKEDLMYVDSKQPEILTALVIERLQSENSRIKTMSDNVILKNPVGFVQSSAELIYHLKIQEMLCALYMGFEAYRDNRLYDRLLEDSKGNPYLFSLNNYRIFGELLFDAVEMDADITNMELDDNNNLLLHINVVFRLLQGI